MPIQRHSRSRISILNLYDEYLYNEYLYDEYSIAQLKTKIEKHLDDASSVQRELSMRLREINDDSDESILGVDRFYSLKTVVKTAQNLRLKWHRKDALSMYEYALKIYTDK